MNDNTLIVNDWSDQAERDRIMDEYGKDRVRFIGKNANGEDAYINVSPDMIVTKAMHDDGEGWHRKNYYYYGKNHSEETFVGEF